MASALTNEDDEIHCFKANGAIPTRRILLQQARLAKETDILINLFDEVDLSQDEENDVILVCLAIARLIFTFLNNHDHGIEKDLTNNTVVLDEAKSKHAWNGLTADEVAIFSTCGIIVHGLILYGLKKEKAWTFIPYLIVKPLEIISLIAAIDHSTSLITSITSISGAGERFGVSALTLVVIVKIWFWIIIMKTYRYFKNLSR
uniref:Uncharacterized protein n=1 Tax=Acrobeloides nanus TaxID=290746 RepID=A0A914CRA2_9BILA